MDPLWPHPSLHNQLQHIPLHFMILRACYGIRSSQPSSELHVSIFAVLHAVRTLGQRPCRQAGTSL